jgi:hypothetical protein
MSPAQLPAGFPELAQDDISAWQCAIVNNTHLLFGRAMPQHKGRAY